MAEQCGMSSLAFRSATDLAALIRSKQVSSEELLDLYLARVETLNPRLTAVVALDISAARKRAREADEALHRGEVWGPLHGVPMTLKDTFDVVGMPSTWGVPELKDNYPAKNAPAVEKFLDAGAVVFGKTNIAAYHVGWVTKNDVYGTTSNPWDLSRSPGGSAGGAAAALAAGLTSLEIGVDFGGGVRNIAHYCGIWSHKPTYGVTNLMGSVLPGIGSKPDMAVIGPIARSPADLKLALSIMIGPHPDDAIAWRIELPPPRREGVAGLRVAVLPEHADFPVEAAVKDRIQAVADFLALRGAEVDETARPAIDLKAAFRIFNGLLVMPMMARRQDEQFWTRLSHLTQYFFTGGGEAEPQDETRLLSYANWMMLDNSRKMVCGAWSEFFKDYDVLLCPAAPGVAVPHDADKLWHQRRLDVNGKPLSVVEATMWGAMATLGNLPATVAPAGFSASGLPVGVQIIGPQYGDHTCIALAQYLERNFQGFVPPRGWE
jgi:amidase